MLKCKCLPKQVFHVSADWVIVLSDLTFPPVCVASMTSRSVAPLICPRPWQVRVMGLWWRHWPGLHRRRICTVVYLCVSQQIRFTGKMGSAFKIDHWLFIFSAWFIIMSVFFFISQSEMRCIIVAVAKARILSGKNNSRNIFFVNIWIQMRMPRKCRICLRTNALFEVNESFAHLHPMINFIHSNFFYLKHVTAECSKIHLLWECESHNFFNVLSRVLYFNIFFDTHM